MLNRSRHALVFSLSILILFSSWLPTAPIARAGGISQEAKLLPPPDMKPWAFGTSVALDDNTLVIGAPEAGDAINPLQSMAFVYSREGSEWSLVQTLRPNTPSLERSYVFGYSVAIDNDVIVIGAPAEESGRGAAYVFRRTERVWHQESRLTASDVSSYPPRFHFGFAVAVSKSTVVIGAPKKEDCNQFSGGAYVYVCTGSGWTEQAVLQQPAPCEYWQFGFSASIAGDTIVIGSPDPLGGGNARGAAHVFLRRIDTWTLIATVAPGGGPNQRAFQGMSVVVVDNDIVVSAPWDSDSSGAVYSFELKDAILHQGSVVKPSIPSSEPPFRFGDQVAMSVGHLAVSEPYHPLVGDQDLWPGTVSLFRGNRGGWVLQEHLFAADGASGDRFGRATAIDGDTLIVAAPQKEGPSGEFRLGAVYIYRIDSDLDGTFDSSDTCTDTDDDGFGNPGFTSNSCPPDNCQEVFNPDQADSDEDGLGDACDTCPDFVNDDTDADGVCDGMDNCITLANPIQEDRDGDGIGDVCDNCPNALNPDQRDSDGDGTGDACERIISSTPNSRPDPTSAGGNSDPGSSSNLSTLCGTGVAAAAVFLVACWTGFRRRVHVRPRHDFCT